MDCGHVEYLRFLQFSSALKINSENVTITYKHSTEWPTNEVDPKFGRKINQSGGGYEMGAEAIKEVGMFKDASTLE